MTSPLAQLGQRVEAARLDKGWSKEQAARIAGISTITWKRVEDGQSVHDTKRSAVLRALGMESGDEIPSAHVIPSTDEGLIEFEVSGDFGVRVIVKGPVSNARELEQSVSRLIQDIRRQDADEAAQ